MVIRVKVQSSPIRCRFKDGSGFAMVSTKAGFPAVGGYDAQVTSKSLACIERTGPMNIWPKLEVGCCVLCAALRCLLSPPFSDLAQQADDEETKRMMAR